MKELLKRLQAQLVICKAKKDKKGIALYEKACNNIQSKIDSGKTL